MVLVGILTLLVCVTYILHSKAGRRSERPTEDETPLSDPVTPPPPVSDTATRNQPAAGQKVYPVIPVPASRKITGKCWVIDGDTIKIGATKIRLAGVDAPELDMPWGKKSKWAMMQLCKGQHITVELTGEQSHDRLVGTCYLPDGRDLGAELIKQGLALDYALFSNGKYRHLEPRGTRKKLKWVYIQEKRQEQADAQS